ncbi:hypothetical protein OJ996_07025 [Luteolibacter sp. GHJ8]|uniref:Uncharacterized protein n=1 Tax=Luteolibacter rhizosphaerae TaxID=2989719 RepID=A0ABT3G0G4_9BACT|nr:hypothetical protein [Luteolibacter rhizosphaerae]MCW1913317.1 hypothetical protein [Luteolibacter rhizosphaerae]
MAGKPPVFKHPLQRQLESQILPEVRFQDADFMDAIFYLQLQALSSSKHTLQVPFIVQLPPDFKPRHELTLDLKSVPAWEAFRHLCGQAGVEFSIARNSVWIRHPDMPATSKTVVRTLIPAPVVPDPGKAQASPLRKPARPFGTGHNNHYTTSGEIQPQRSGTVKHRNLSGWAIDMDPGNRFSMNCIDIARCKAKCDGKCGCYACACQPPKDKAVPAKP